MSGRDSMSVNPTKRWSVLLLLGLVLTTTSYGEEQAKQDEDEFELAGTDIGKLGDGGALDLADASFVGNPMSSVSRGWPEDLVIAPVPGRSPQIGWNLTLAAGYFFDNDDAEDEVEDGDENTRRSAIGGFAMIAENGSYAYGAGANLHLLDDNLRVKAGAAFADIRYAFYGIGNDLPDLGISVDILQEMPLYFGSASYRVWSKLYVGLGYLGGSVDSTLRFSLSDPLPFLDPSLKLDLGAITIPVQYDSRDHEQSPSSGWLINGRASLYRESVGGDFDADIFMVNINHYRPVRERDVLAFRAYARTTSGDDTPFFLLSTFGGSTDLRGYPSGRYRDEMMYALQSEYRWRYSDKWIFTGFVGFGEVAEKFSDFGENFLPAGGIGARFMLSQKHRISLSADIAVGKDGTEYYFGVGEAF